MGFNDMLGEFSILFSCASACLDYGLDMVETRTAQLEYYDKLTWDCLDDDVIDASSLNEASEKIAGTNIDCSELREIVSFARDTFKVMEILNQDTSLINEKFIAWKKI